MGLVWNDSPQRIRNRQVIGSSPIVGSILPGVSWCTQLDLGRLIDAIELYQPSELLRLTPGMPAAISASRS